MQLKGGVNTIDKESSAQNNPAQSIQARKRDSQGLEIGQRTVDPLDTKDNGLHLANNILVSLWPEAPVYVQQVVPNVRREPNNHATVNDIVVILRTAGTHNHPSASDEKGEGMVNGVEDSEHGE